MISVASNLEKGVFLRRLNRFVGEFVNKNGDIALCHILNPGRMKEFLVKDAPILVEKSQSKQRKLNYSLIYVQKKDVLIGIDSILPNKLFEDALKNRKIEEFKNYTEYYREYPYGHDGKSKIDFLIDGKIFVEIKSTNCVIDGEARFPDAPSTRAQKHLKELITEMEKGNQAYVVFLIKRNDAQKVRPYDEIDPEFGNLLRMAIQKGLKVIAFTINYFDEGKHAALGKRINFFPNVQK
jgi:sugar fermentation stimulation protein A